MTYSQWITGIEIGNTAATAIWINNGVWTGSNRYITPPTSGTSQYQYIGTKFNSLYADVRFMVYMSPQCANFQNAYRVMVVKCKTGNTTGTGLPNLPTDVLTPVDTKLWDLYYDKTFCGGTGYHAAANNAFNIQDKQRIFKFKIPLKMTFMETSSIMVYPYSVGIFMITQHAQGCYVPLVDCKFVFRDP